jgi:hypothetical protein
MCWVRRFGFSTVTAPPRSLGLEYERLAAQQKAQKLVGELAKCKKVSRPFPSWSRCMLTEISLWHACSYHEMLRAETAGQEVVNATRQLQALGGFEVVRPEELLRRAYILLDSMIRAKAVH